MLRRLRASIIPATLFVLLITLLAPAAWAQYSYSALYSFTGRTDGDNPVGGLISDSRGNLYGVTSEGGDMSDCDFYGCGVVFELSPPASSGGSWTETVLYDFGNVPDGEYPEAGVVFDAKGNLYGTTSYGGANGFGGDAFELSPPSSGSGAWSETILYSFGIGSEGNGPTAPLIIDSHGNLYGTTAIAAFELSPPGGSGGEWTLTPLHVFTGGSDGGTSSGAGLVLDSEGNLYGTTMYGGNTTACVAPIGTDNAGCGVVYELSPPSSGSGAWSETVLHSFTGGSDGGYPLAGLVFGSRGNLYGTASVGGTGRGTDCSGYIAGCGVAFELSPPTGGSGSWTETVLYDFPDGSAGAGPDSPLIFDPQGNLYGSTGWGGVSPDCTDCGMVFELSPPASGSGLWTETAISSAIAHPTSGNLTFDSAHNLYGMESANGAGYGLVFKLSLPSTTTALVSSLNPSSLGDSVTFTATVSPAGPPAPTGTVAFTSNGTTISGCSAVAISAARTAVCETSSLPAGKDSIVAAYSGNSSYAGSSSSPLSQVVNKITSITVVTSSQSPSTVANSVTLTATVTPAGPPTPTGTVGFTSNGATITGCSAVVLSSSRSAACTTATLPLGTDAITATYSGDSSYSGSSGTFSQLENPVATPVQFVPMTPCRVVDTRGASGNFGGPAITGGTFRSFAIPSGPCSGIPAGAAAYSLNVTVVPPAGGTLSYLTMWPTGEGQPTSSTLNSLDGRIKADAAIVSAGSSGAVSVYASNTTNVLLDINGYFEASSGTSLEFYPLTPCRVADTRKTPDGPLAGPTLVGASERDFPILSSACGIPTGAQAYSLNFTVIPPSGENLGYLTVWPEGQSKPLVSTLNDPTGTIVANAAIVPAGTSGGIAVYPSSATNLVIDVNGYLATPETGGLQLYALTPCRVLDTRKTTGAFSDELTVSVADSACAPPSMAQAYVFNATAVPPGDLGYLTLWPDGETQPVVSTLNAEDGAITSNMAIVPNTDGKTDAYASGTTQLILDISAYFAP
ncbi:MAG: Ig-like domain-containing protein [Terriglobales bacterium]